MTDPNFPIETLERALRRGVSRRELMGSLAAAGFGAAASGLVLRASTALAQTPKIGGLLRVAGRSASTADTLDPSRGALTTDYARAFMFYNGLTRLDSSLTPQPELAQSFTSEDATTWHVKLHGGVLFADGTSLAPADVIYTVNRIKDPATGSSARALAAQISEIVTDGPRSLRIVLEAPNADLPIIFGMTAFMIVKAGTTDFSKANGTGPYRLREFTPGLKSMAVRKTDYWKNGKPYIEQLEYSNVRDETVRINALLAGKIEMAPEIAPGAVRQVKAAPGFTVTETKTGNYNDFILRQDVEPARDADLALALKYVSDRGRMQTALGGGAIGNDHPIYPDHPYYNAGLPQRSYDPDRAKFHFQKSRLGNTALPLYVMTGHTMADQALVLQQSALGIGMKLDVQRMPAKGYWSDVWGRKPFSGGNINPRPSTDWLFTLFFKSDAPWNETGWKNERFDQLLLAARAEMDAAKRKPMYGEMQVLIAEQNSIGIPVFNSVYDGHTKRLKGLETIPTGGMMGFGFCENVWLEG